MVLSSVPQSPAAVLITPPTGYGSGVINGDDMTPGTALLLAAAPEGKGRLTDATSVLATLAAVPPSALTGTTVATVVELADPMDPQTVLTRLRAVSAAPGPLYVYIAGQLQLDRKQRLVHLALARTTATTVRYSGLPWHWLATELAVRPPGTTTVVVDLVADAAVWEQLVRGGLGPGVRLYGRVAPPPVAAPRSGPAISRPWPRSGVPERGRRWHSSMNWPRPRVDPTARCCSLPTRARTRMRTEA